MAQGPLSKTSGKRDAEEIVIDTNIFVVSLVEENRLNEEEKRQRPLAMTYVNGLENGYYLAHLPRIAIIEIVGVIGRKAGSATAAAIKSRLEQWTGLGLIKLYDLDERRMRSATDLVIQHNISRQRSLSAPDVTFITLAEELGVNVVTFEKYFQAVSHKAVVPA